MLVAITSGKTAPGTTTSTWALGLTWPAAALVADCDPAGGDMAPGLLGGRVTLDRGLLSWIVTTRRSPAPEAAAAFQAHIVAIPEAPQLWLLPGLQDASQSPALDVSAWQRLANAFTAAAEHTGMDVLVDTGRLGDASCWPVLRVADVTVLVVRPTLRSVHAAIAASVEIRAQLGDLARVRVLVVGAGPYSPNEVATAVGAPLLGTLPEDRDGARMLSDGAREGLRGLHRTRILRAARGLGAQLRTETKRVTAGVS